MSAEANVNTTELEVPQTMQLDMTPTPEPIKSDEDSPPVFKDEARDAIFAKRKQILTDEMTSQGLELPLTEQELKTEAKQEEPVIDTKITPEPVIETKPETKVETTPEQEDFILNVYGVQKKYTKDELIREAQKGAAASQVFNEGYRMKQEAMQIADAVKQNLQPQQAAKENPPQSAPAIDDNKAREIAKRINYGSEEDQINAIKDLGASIEARVRGQAQSLPPEQLVNYATQQALAVIEARTEQEALRTEFSDILADRALSSAADVIANELSQKYQSEGINKSRLELFREAGKTARERYLKPVEAITPPVQPAAPPAIVVSNDKIERKRAAPKPPAAANKVAVEPPPAYGVGVASIVNQMRKARGQPILT